jgi:excisionase family DNA binding protein
MDSNIERWYSMKEISNHLGVSRDTVLSWIEKRNMPASKIGRLWKFKISEVDEWIHSGGAADKY